MDADDDMKRAVAETKELVERLGRVRDAGFAAGLEAAAKVCDVAAKQSEQDERVFREQGNDSAACEERVASVTGRQLARRIRALAPSAPPDALDALTRAIAMADGWGVPNDHHRRLGEAAFAAVERTWDAAPPPSDIPDDVRDAAQYLRPKVLAFALLMERKLRENDHKGGWNDERAQALMKRLREETKELSMSLEEHLAYVNSSARSVEDAPRCYLPTVDREAADVANFAMMVADVCGTIPTLAAILDAIRAREAGR